MVIKYNLFIYMDLLVVHIIIVNKNSLVILTV